MLRDVVYPLEAIPVDLMHMVFLPIAFGAFQDWTDDQIRETALFGVLSDAETAATTVNGWPIFTCCHVWRRHDFNRAMAMAAEMLRQMEAVQVPSGGLPTAEDPLV